MTDIFLNVQWVPLLKIVAAIVAAKLLGWVVHKYIAWKRANLD